MRSKAFRVDGEFDNLGEREIPKCQNRVDGKGSDEKRARDIPP